MFNCGYSYSYSELSFNAFDDARVVLFRETDKDIFFFSRGQDLGRLDRQLTIEELAEYGNVLVGWGANRPEIIIVSTPKELPFDALDDAQSLLYGKDLFLVSQ